MPYQNPLTRKWYRRLRPTLSHIQLHMDEDGRLYAEFQSIGISPKKKAADVCELSSSEVRQLEMIQSRTSEDGRLHLCPRPWVRGKEVGLRCVWKGI